MVLIIGGMAQGKLDFVRRQLGVTAWSTGVLGAEDCVYGLQDVLRAQPEADRAEAVYRVRCGLGARIK